MTSPAPEFTPTCQPDDPTLTGQLLDHLHGCIGNHDGAAAVETLKHLNTAAGQQYTSELIRWMIACGLASLVPNAE
jgi:hypothetical protein